MAEQRLNQLLAVDKALKQKSEQFITGLYHTAQKPALFDGMARTYRPLTEDGERLPPETRLVQQRATDLIGEAFKALGELFDLRASIDWANTTARADVVVDGQVLLSDVPATHLLFLEKKLIDIQTIVEKVPVLDPAEMWNFDAADQLYKTAPAETARTQKVQEHIVVVQATDKFPAQVATASVDKIIGYYELVKFSGALPMADRRRILARIQALRASVKFAREQANLVHAPKQEVGRKIFEYLLSE